MSVTTVVVVPFLVALLIMGLYAITTNVTGLNSDQRAIIEIEAVGGGIILVVMAFVLTNTGVLAELNEFPTNLVAAVSMAVQCGGAFWLMTQQDKKFGFSLELPD